MKALEIKNEVTFEIKILNKTVVFFSSPHIIISAVNAAIKILLIIKMSSLCKWDNGSTSGFSRESTNRETML